MYDVDNGTQEIKNAGDYGNIFLFTQPGVRPLSTDSGSALSTKVWLQASPETVANYSAVCYETARNLVDLHLGKSIPIGLIWTAVGGTPVQHWMPEPAFSYQDCHQKFNRSNQDASLFDTIIRPLQNYSHRGVIWYQGEANVKGHQRYLGGKYGGCFKAMISEWRNSFGIGDFAFIFVQLSPYRNSGNISEVRMQQASALPAPGIGDGVDTTGMVVTIDTGDVLGTDRGVHSHHKAVSALTRRALALALTLAHAPTQPLLLLLLLRLLSVLILLLLT